MKSGNINQFKHLSQFDSIKDFNNSIEQWMIDYKSEFTKSELIALKRLIRFSAKVFGVCNAKIQTIVSSTHNGSVGISRSTFERMLRKAKSFGILTVHNTFCGSNQRHNVYVLNVYKSTKQIESETLNNEVPETIDVPNQETSLDKTNNIITKRNIINVPDQFAEYLSAYFTGKEIIELWKCVKHATKYLNHYDLTAKVILGVNAMRNMREQLKEGYRVKKSMFSLYWGIVNRMLDREYKELIVSC